MRETHERISSSSGALQEIVVTALKRAATSQSVPITVKVLFAQLPDAAGLTDGTQTRDFLGSPARLGRFFSLVPCRNSSIDGDVCTCDPVAFVRREKHSGRCDIRRFTYTFEHYGVFYQGPHDGIFGDT